MDARADKFSNGHSKYMVVELVRLVKKHGLCAQHRYDLMYDLLASSPGSGVFVTFVTFAPVQVDVLESLVYNI